MSRWETPTLWEPRELQRALNGSALEGQEESPPATPTAAATKSETSTDDDGEADRAPVADLVVPDVEAPESTKLFFACVRTAADWQALYSAYSRKFGRAIKAAGTGYMPSKRVAYINFETRADMERGLAMREWSPKEARQRPPSRQTTASSSKASKTGSSSGRTMRRPEHAAFAVGFENWPISVIQPLALELLGAQSLELRAQSDEHPDGSPGVALGWGIVGYATKEQLDAALRKKKFVLQCSNKTTVIALQPYREREPKHAQPATNASIQERGWAERRAAIARWRANGQLSPERARLYLEHIAQEEAAAKKQGNNSSWKESGPARR